MLSKFTIFSPSSQWTQWTTFSPVSLWLRSSFRTTWPMLGLFARTSLTYHLSWSHPNHELYSSEFGFHLDWHTQTPETYYWGKGKVWVKKKQQQKKHSHHPATRGHQTGGPKEKEEVCDLPSFERQKSQQLVFPMHQACVQGARRLSVHLWGM